MGYTTSKTDECWNFNNTFLAASWCCKQRKKESCNILYLNKDDVWLSLSPRVLNPSKLNNLAVWVQIYKATRRRRGFCWNVLTRERERERDRMQFCWKWKKDCFVLHLFIIASSSFVFKIVFSSAFLLFLSLFEDKKIEIFATKKYQTHYLFHSQWRIPQDVVVLPSGPKYQQLTNWRQKEEFKELSFLF